MNQPQISSLFGIFLAKSGLLNKVITGDKTWVFEYDPETKPQESPLEEFSITMDQKTRQSKSQIKFMLIVFFEVRDMVYYESLPQGLTVYHRSVQQFLLMGHKYQLQTSSWATKNLLFYIHNNLHNSLNANYIYYKKMSIGNVPIKLKIFKKTNYIYLTFL